ncbi:MAG: hypothetical protein AAFX85_07495, partial [Pseudomonadota bacterium]
RFVGFSELMPGLVTTPVLSQTVRDVQVHRCEGNERRQRCHITAAVEVFSRAVNMPTDMPQTALVEALGFPSRRFEQSLDVEFRRRNARWVLQDDDELTDRLFDLTTARITKSTGQYLLEKLRTLPSP